LFYLENAGKLVKSYAGSLENRLHPVDYYSRWLYSDILSHSL